MAEVGCIAAATGALGVALGVLASEGRHRRQVPSCCRTAVSATVDHGRAGPGPRWTVHSLDADSEHEQLENGHSSASIDLANRRKVYGLGGFCTYNRVLLCMVGLPARGKSYIVAMLTRYLRWTGFPVKTFNAGSLRRQEGMAGADANFFRTDDEAVATRREQLASRCMEEAISWLASQNDVSVAIFDATNTTKKRRRAIADACRKIPGITPVFVESICDDPKVLEANYRMKLGNDDYKNIDPAKARADFLERVRLYEERYETITDDEESGAIRYIKLFNVGQKVVLKHCSGYAPSNIGFYLSNIHITPRRIWLARHALTTDSMKGILGSHSGKLARQGKEYCRAVSVYLRRALREVEEGEGRYCVVYMGTAPVHQATCDALSSTRQETPTASAQELAEAAEAAKLYPVMSTSLLNELDGGDCNGMSYDQIQSEFPEVWAAREQDKLNFRYPGPGGESYIDVINRLRPVIVELERNHRSILVISHLAVQRCIFAYFTGATMEELPYIDMDMHTLYELHPGPFGTRVVAVPLGS
mmetsp:Transcript_19768/g.55740  ORF Transcript_19768/g.55740 Transcript_19768/m.55740 type:complete len:533 (+) Transcript_19768:49-1647(+)